MVGQTVGKYRVEDRIGRGGMGTVYRAMDETLHRDVAIKVLNSELNDPEVAKRFRAEAITVARLSHPGIATVYELFEHDGQWLMVMEFVKGETLERLIERAGPLTAERASDLTMQALSALSHAHSLGVVHRDLKPANIMLTDGGSVKIMDFGIARVSGSEHLTSAGFMMGTPAYMAPEQVLGQEVDARADLYAMGVVLYRLTTGKLPFKGETPFALAQSQVNDPPTPVRTAREGLPQWLEEVIGRALAKPPAERFQTAQDFREVLKRCVAGLPMERPFEAAAPTGMMLTPPGMPTGSLTSRNPTGPNSPIVPASGTGSVPVAAAGTGGVPSTGPSPIPGVTAADMPTTASGVHSMPQPYEANPAYAATMMQPASGRIATGAIAAGGTGATAVGAAGSGAQPIAAGLPITPSGPQPVPIVAPPVAAGAPKPLPAKTAGAKSSMMPVIAAAAVIVILIVAGAGLMWRHHRATVEAENEAAAAAAAATAAAAAAPPVASPDTSTTTPSVTPPPPTVDVPQKPATPAPVSTTPAVSAPVTTTPAKPTAVTPAPVSAPPVTGSGTAPAGGHPPATAAPPASTPALPAVDDSFLAFKDIKFLVVKDQDSQDQDALVNFGQGQILVVPKDGGPALATVGYKKLVHATYAHTKDPKFDPTLPGPPASLNIHGFMRGARHWLVLQTKTDFTILRLDDSNWVRVLDTIETRTGIKVDRPADGGGS